MGGRTIRRHNSALAGCLPGTKARAVELGSFQRCHSNCFRDQLRKNIRAAWPDWALLGWMGAERSSRCAETQTPAVHVALARCRDHCWVQPRAVHCSAERCSMVAPCCVARQQDSRYETFLLKDAVRCLVTPFLARKNVFPAATYSDALYLGERPGQRMVLKHWTEDCCLVPTSYRPDSCRGSPTHQRLAAEELNAA